MLPNMAQKSPQLAMMKPNAEIMKRTQPNIVTCFSFISRAHSSRFISPIRQFFLCANSAAVVGFP